MEQGDAFALDARTQLCLVGGFQSTNLLNLNEPDTITKSHPIDYPLKWQVSNYEWDLFNSAETERFLQTVWYLLLSCNSKSNLFLILF